MYQVFFLNRARNHLVVVFYMAILKSEERKHIGKICRSLKNLKIVPR